LARVIRGFVVPAYEDVPLWHERDLTNSAAERIILPHAAVLVDDILAKTADVFRGLRVYPDRMRANLEATKGQVMAEAVMIALESPRVPRGPKSPPHSLKPTAGYLAPCSSGPRSRSTKKSSPPRSGSR